jgi:hypothetical protein
MPRLAGIVQTVELALRLSMLPPVTRHWYCSVSPSASDASTLR